MALKLFTVEIAREVVVLAETREAAEEVALDERHDIEMNDDPSCEAHRMTALPFGWDDRCLPYSGLDAKDARRDWNIGQWREAIAVDDAEAKRVAEFNAKQLAMPGVG